LDGEPASFIEEKISKKRTADTYKFQQKSRGGGVYLRP
jgi:hypothetical protein